MLIRGTWSALFFEKAGSPIFIGKKVKIKCKGKITAGNCVSFQDYVLIDALSKEGMFFGDNVSVGMRSMIKVSGSLSTFLVKSLPTTNQGSLEVPLPPRPKPERWPMV